MLIHRLCENDFIYRIQQISTAYFNHLCIQSEFNYNFMRLFLHDQSNQEAFLVLFKLYSISGRSLESVTGGSFRQGHVFLK